MATHPLAEFLDIKSAQAFLLPEEGDRGIVRIETSGGVQHLRFSLPALEELGREIGEACRQARRKAIRSA